MFPLSIRRHFSFKTSTKKVTCSFCRGKHTSEECKEAISDLEKFVSLSSLHILEDQCVQSTLDLELRLDLAKLQASLSKPSRGRFSDQEFILKNNSIESL
ncbi:hypothetical protein K7432_007606 [Basidiobolus ranarum]|uniref:Uncharacterized protein n=1 Tax=Basidiobolus ranarum TaxID=34480 RepID=A0ABR2WT53_9FUNG